jgi:nucleoside-diphosphate-sugar epimerase
MKLLLTGSSGFIGSHLTPDLQKNFELFHLKSDLLDHKKVQDEVASISPDIIVHLAARTEVEKSFYEQTSFSEVNYVGTVNLIEAASRVKNLKNFVFASTMEVYGWQPISDEIKCTTSLVHTLLLMKTHTPILMPHTPLPNMVVKNI